MASAAARAFARVVASLGPSPAAPEEWTDERLAHFAEVLTGEVKSRVELSTLSEADRQRAADLFMAATLMIWISVSEIGSRSGTDWLDVLSALEAKVPASSSENEL